MKYSQSSSATVERKSIEVAGEGARRALGVARSDPEGDGFRELSDVKVNPCEMNVQ